MKTTSGQDALTTRPAHTPGPWRVGFKDGSGDGTEIITEAEFTDKYGTLPISIAEIDKQHRAWNQPPSPEAVANARLIAAAPDMLAALKAIKKELQLSGNWEARDYGWPENRKAIDNAIQEAEGDQ